MMSGLPVTANWYFFYPYQIEREKIDFFTLRWNRKDVSLPLKTGIFLCLGAFFVFRQHNMQKGLR